MTPCSFMRPLSQPLPVTERAFSKQLKQGAVKGGAALWKSPLRLAAPDSSPHVPPRSHRAYKNRVIQQSPICQAESRDKWGFAFLLFYDSVPLAEQVKLTEAEVVAERLNFPVALAVAPE